MNMQKANKNTLAMLFTTPIATKFEVTTQFRFLYIFMYVICVCLLY